MKRQPALLAAAVAAAASALILLPGNANSAVSAVRAPLVIAEDFADPDVVQIDGTYYGYATNNRHGNVPVAAAPAPTGPWTVRGDALPRLGAWADGGLTWAPDVSRRADGKLLLYYTARSRAAGRQCIGAALADQPTGPFTPIGTQPLVCNAAEGGDIDASSYVENGTRYLLYKNDGNAIGAATTLWLQRMAADGITPQGSRVALLRNDRAEENGVIEAPILVKRPSRYVLFYSQGSYAGDGYATGYATSSTLTGPYAKAYRPLLTTTSMDGAVRGPGGADIVQPAQSQIVCHGWINDYSARGVYVAELGWANDLPVVRGSRVRYEAENGTLNNAVVRANAVNASQSKVVAKIDYADSWVEISVFAASAGGYTANIAYAAGYGAAQHTMTVNGAAPIVVDYPNTGWDTYRQVAVDIQLRAGFNVLRLTHRSAFAELDYLEVA